VRRGDNGAGAATAPALAPVTEPAQPNRIVVPAFAPGDVVGDLYEIVDGLGGGHRYSTYHARHLRWMVDVVLKVPRQERFERTGAGRTITEQAARWTSLGLHPHIAYCHYVDAIDKVPIIVTEYLEGDNLRSWIVARRTTDRRVALNVAVQVCHALAHAHARGVCHGAVLPENVLLSDQGIACLTDVWGETAMAAEPARDRRAPRSPVAAPLSARPAHGHAAYVAPEQWVDGAVVDEQTDVFALGVCLYELLCGTRPYEIARGPRREAPPPALQGEELPAPLSQLLRRCVDWEREHRPPSVRHVRDQLCAAHEQLFGRPSPVAEVDDRRCDADGWNNQAVAAILRERPNDAEAAWQKALEIDPEHVQALYNYGVVRWRRGELPEDDLTGQLAELYERSNAKGPVAHALGLVYLERAVPEVALEFLEEAVAEAPERADLREVTDQARLRAEETEPGIAKLTGHRAFVSGVAISDDGQRVLSAGEDNSLCLWDATTRTPVRVLEGHSGRVLAVRMTGDGTTAISGGDDATLRIWDLQSGECRKTIRTPGQVTSVAIGANGAVGISASGTGDDFAGMENTAVQVWDLKSGKCLRKLEGHRNTVRAIALTADARQALTGGDDQTVRLWNVASGSCLRVFEGHEHYVSCVAIDARGGGVLSGSWDQTLRVWDTVVGSCRRVLTGHRGIVMALSLSGDGHLAVSGSLDGTVRIWEVATGRCLRTFEGHTSLITGVDLDGTGKRAASGSWDHTVRVWDVQGAEGTVAPLQLSRRSMAVAAPLLQPSNDELLVDAEKALAAGELGVALDALQRVRAGGAASPRATHLWRRLSQKCARQSVNAAVPYAELHPKEKVSRMLLGAEARAAVTGMSDGRLCVWNVDLERCARTMEGHADRIRDLSVDGRSEMLLSASADRTLRVWALETGDCVQTLQGHESVVSAACLSKDARLALSGSYDHTLRLWDVDSGRCLRVFAGHTRQVLSVALSDDARWAVSAGYDGLRVWNASTGECVATPDGHEGAVRCVGLSADARLLLSGGVDGTLRLWKLPSGECLHTLGSHDGGVCRAVLGADGAWAFSAAGDGALRLWDLDCGEARELGVSARSDVASISPDFCWVALGEGTDRVKLLEIDWNLCLAGRSGSSA
jgi:WD40 repeat protein